MKPGRTRTTPDDTTTQLQRCTWLITLQRFRHWEKRDHSQNSHVCGLTDSDMCRISKYCPRFLQESRSKLWKCESVNFGYDLIQIITPNPWTNALVGFQSNSLQLSMQKTKNLPSWSVCCLPVSVPSETAGFLLFLKDKVSSAISEPTYIFWVHTLNLLFQL